MGLPSLISRVPRAGKDEPEPIRQLVSFRIGSEEFGVDILMLQEIIRLPVITPIPNSPRFIMGMINLRGRIIPVVDLRQRLQIRGIKPIQENRKTRILIVEIFEHVTGFIVDSVSEVMKVPISEIEPAPHLLASGIDSEYIQGVVKLGDRLVVLLDFRKILRPQEKEQLDGIGMDLAHARLETEAPRLEIPYSSSLNSSLKGKQ